MQNNRLHPIIFDVAMIIKDNLLFMLPEAKRKNIHISAECNGSIPVFADIEMINLVIRNLLANAIKFTPDKGEIIVTYQANSKFAIVKIKDTGVGMSEVVQQKILDKEIFTTLGTNKEKGTGLGLLFCQEFISLNGGFFGIYSEAGKGSEFTFSIPLQIKL
jgi:two-component system, sensor histidine kinase and response regulator